MARRIRSSRLSRYAEKQSRKQFMLFGLGTLIIIFLLVQFAGPLLGLFGNIIFGIRGEDAQSQNNSLAEEVLLPPTIDSLPAATSSAQIDVSGSSSYSDGRIYLFVNSEEIDSSRLSDDKEFTFRKVGLQNGENTIKTQYVLDDKKSEFSEEILIIRSSEKPMLELSNPSDGTTFRKADKRINVSGKTDITSSVTVNGFRAVVDSDGNFSYFLELNDGDNKITVISTNQAGVSEQKELTVKYES